MPGRSFPVRALLLLCALLPAAAQRQTGTTTRTAPLPPASAARGILGQEAAQAIPFTIQVRASVDPQAARAGVEAPPAPAGGQSPAPGSTRGNMIEAIDRYAVWTKPQVKTALPGSPVEVKLVGESIVSLVRLVPFDMGGGKISIVASGQVWIRMTDGTVQYRVTMDTLSIPVADRLLFFPLGFTPEGIAPLIVEIVVDRPAR